jgi:hypothetical protein
MSIILADSYSPVSVGDTGALFNPQFKYDNGDPIDLTDADISMIMQDDEGNLAKNAEGVFTITDAANGLTSYAYDASDVAVSGIWTLYIKITISGKQVHPDDGRGFMKKLEIKPVPTVS